MIKNNLTLLIIILFSFLLYSCQTAQDALQGKKRSEQSDEFLVEKKSPLAIPPDFEKLPVPGNNETSTSTLNNNEEVKELLNLEDIANNNNENNDTDTLESSILEKIQ